MPSRVFAAVDIGASGGRVMAGVVGTAGNIALHEVHRFHNSARVADGHLRWDIGRLYDQVLDGLTRLAREFPEVESVGIDTWGVDYGLLDSDRTLIANPIAYRDERATTFIDTVHELVAPDELYAINGLQFLPFTTIYQLEAEKRSRRWNRTAHVVLLPDLIAYWFTGNLRTEATNASTTGLVDVATGGWSTELLERLEIPADRLAPIEQPGEIRGSIRAELCRAIGLRVGTVVTTVASHDTASAVVAVPASRPRFAYIVSGTWSLVGIETQTPVLSEASRTENFTNEAGVDGRTRFLRNVGGLWLLQECLRTWNEADPDRELRALLTEATALPAGGPIIEVDAPELIPPGDMPDRIAAAVEARGRAPLMGRAQMVRCILDSLADAYRVTVAAASALADQAVEVVHLVGGGVQNELLCQLTADAVQRRVTAGPVEATSLGNVVIQARSHGAAPAALDDIRATIGTGPGLKQFEPRRTTQITS
jgi:rhamnulokinase